MKTLLMGDLCPTDDNKEFFQKEDLNTLFTDTLPLFEGNDFTILNLECAITESENAIKKFGPNLKAPIETVNIMKKLNVDYCGLSNNHIFDFGIEGANDTINALEKAGIECTGFGANYEDSRKNLYIEKNGERIAIVAVCEHEYSYALDDRMGSRPFDEFDTMEDIRNAKKESDRVIVLYHGGKEHSKYPSPRLIRVCRAMAKNGADVVLCQHTHCIGSYEKFNDCHILYGQGNFHFVREVAPTALWNSLLAVKYDTKSHEIDFIPIVNTKNGITLAKDKEKVELMSGFEKRNEELQNGEWKKGWHDFCLSVEEQYKTVLKNACTEEATDRQNANFGHYLDCEAHTDVWRELFPTWNQTNEK